MRWSGCCGSRCSGGLPATKMSMTPCACGMIPAIHWISRRQGGFGRGGIAQPDGALRNALADGGEEPLGPRRSVGPLDRPSSMAAGRPEASYST